MLSRGTDTHSCARSAATECRKRRSSTSASDPSFGVSSCPARLCRLLRGQHERCHTDALPTPKEAEARTEVRGVLVIDTPFASPDGDSAGLGLLWKQPIAWGRGS